MNMLCTLMKRDSGRVSIDGHILGEEDGKIEGTIGIAFQGDVLDPLLTVRENLMIRGSLCGLDRDECAERTDEAMTAMGIGDIADRTGCCQGGQKRKADIAKALLNRPELIFLNEPTTGLDPHTKKHIWNLIRASRRKGSPCSSPPTTWRARMRSS